MCEPVWDGQSARDFPGMPRRVHAEPSLGLVSPCRASLYAPFSFPNSFCLVHVAFPQIPAQFLCNIFPSMQTTPRPHQTAACKHSSRLCSVLGPGTPAAQPPEKTESEQRLTACKGGADASVGSHAWRAQGSGRACVWRRGGGVLSRASEMKEGREQCRFELDTEGHGESDGGMSISDTK